MPTGREEVPLIPGTEDSKVARRCTVEPILFLYYMCYWPSILAAELYIFDEKSKENNYTHESNYTGCGYGSGNYSSLALQRIVQQESAIVMLVLNISGTFTSVFSTLLIGALSNHLGRKIPIILPLTGALFKFLTFVLVIALKAHYWTFLIGTIVEGLTGYYPTLTMSCFAHSADTTTADKRTFKLTVCDISIGVACGISQLCAGLLINSSKHGYLYSYLALLGLTALNILYTMFVLQETQKRTKFLRNIGKSLQACADIYLKDVGLGRRRKLQLCLVVQVVVLMVNMSKLDTQTYFLKGKPLCLDPRDIGYFSGGYTLAQNFGNFLGVTCLIRYFDEEILTMISCISGLLSMVMMAFVFNVVTLVLVPLLGSCSFLIFPMVRSISSKLVRPHEQGAMFAVLNSAEAVSNVIGTALFNAVYPLTLSIMPGFVFLVMAAIYFIGFILASIQAYFMKEGRREINTVASEEDNNL